MDNIYKNAWMSITRDKASKPENYFSIMYAKVTKMLKSPSLIKKCEEHDLVFSEDSKNKTYNFFEKNCQSSDFGKSVLALKYLENNHWELNIDSFDTYKRIVGENRVGLGATIDDSTKDSEQHFFSIKPRCTLKFNDDDTNDPRVSEAVCNDFVQNYLPSSDRKNEKATLRLFSIKYDRDNIKANELEVLARKITFDDNNIHCQGAKLLSVAPKNSNKIEKLDDYRFEENQCERSKLASVQIAKAAQSEFLAHHSPVVPANPAAAPVSQTAAPATPAAPTVAPANPMVSANPSPSVNRSTPANTDPTVAPMPGEFPPGDSQQTNAEHQFPPQINEVPANNDVFATSPMRRRHGGRHSNYMRFNNNQDTQQFEQQAIPQPEFSADPQQQGSPMEMPNNSETEQSLNNLGNSNQSDFSSRVPNSH